MKKIYYVLFALLLCGILCLGTTYVRTEDSTVGEDPVWLIWEEFLDTSDRLATVEAWADKILCVIEENPSTSIGIKMNVLRNLVGSCNSAKKYDKSIELLHKALAMDNSVYRNLTAIGELGAVHGLLRKEALNKGDAEMAKKHAEFTLEYYAQYTKKLDSAGAEDLSDREKFDLQQRLVFFKRTEADLLRDVQEDMNASLTKRNEALALLSSNPELTERGMLQGMGFDTAFFLKEKAVQCLDELKKLVPKDVWIERLEQMQEHAVSEHELAEMLMTLEFKKSRPWGPIIGVNVVLMSLIFFLLWRKVMNR